VPGGGAPVRDFVVDRRVQEMVSSLTRWHAIEFWVGCSLPADTNFLLLGCFWGEFC
jgi:hypothetical protein